MLTLHDFGYVGLFLLKQLLYNKYMAVGKFLAPLNGRTIIQQNKPYVDDIFDPLFNAEVRDYYNGLYGPIGGIGAGYAAMLENALTGKKGILGPGMGILSTFGRSMDKADDFILGGLTEGVNLIGNGLGRLNEAPQNPFKRIFVDDYDYQGTKLMAAAGNAMSRLAGTQTPLDESDFQSLGDKIAGTTIDLATDPGIMGGQLARLNPNTPVGQMGQILNNYDDVVANVAGNMAFPGAKAMVGKGLTRIKDFLGGASSVSPQDIVTKTGDIFTIDPTTGAKTYTNLTPPTMDELRNMAEDYKYTYNLNPIETPEEYRIYEDIIDATNYYDEKAFNDAVIKYTKQQEALTKYVNENASSLATKAADYDQMVRDQAFKGIEENPGWFNLRESIPDEPDLSFIRDTDISETMDKIRQELVNEGTDLDEVGYLMNNMSDAQIYDALTKDDFMQMVEEQFFDPRTVTLEKPFGEKYDSIRHLVEDELDLDEAKNRVKSWITERPTKYSSPFTFSQSASNANAYLGKEKLNLINAHVAEFLNKHPEGFNLSYLRKNLGEDIYVPIEKFREGKLSDVNPRVDPFEQIRQFTRGYTLKIDGDKAKYVKIDPDNYGAGKLTGMLGFFKHQNIDIPAGELEGTIEATGLIPWIRNNEELLNKTQYGQDLIKLADNLEQDVFSLDNIQQYADVSGLGINDSLAKIINPIFNGQALLKPEDMEKFAKTFPNFELTLNPNFRGTSYEDLYNHYVEFRKKNKLYGTPYTKLNPINISKKAVNILKQPNIMDYAKYSSELATLSPEDFSTTISRNFSLQDNVATELYDKTFKNFSETWGLPDGMPLDESEYYIRNFGDRNQKTLFQQWIAAVQSKVKNKLKTAHGVFNVDSVKKSKEHIDTIVKSKKYSEAQIEEYISRKDLAEGVKLSGNNFLESIWASKGFKEMPIPKNMTKAQADTVAAQLKKNVEIVNKNGNILKFIDVTGEDKVRRLAVAFDTDNLNIKKDINKIYSLFGKKDLGLSDVIMRNPVLTKTSWDSSELDEVFDEIRQASEDLSRKLGYTNFSKNYISHAMEDTEEAKEMFSKIYKELGIDKDKLDKLTQALQEQDIASGRLQFGALPMERSHLGLFGEYKGGFSKNLSTIHSSTFTQGMLDNTNAQTFFDLFLSDNFKISQNFDNVETLKKALNLSEGNLNNLSIVKPRYNESGKLIGFTKYDKFSNSALAKAFADEEAILVPDSVIGSLDRMCKKDARMSSKVYRFINKYLTVPFKFGTLANPGFLAGNIQDAYFKQATELSKKYGTTLSEELTNVAFSMRQVTQLNNSFSDVFDGYKQWLKDTDIKNITRSDRPVDWYNKTFSKSKNMVETLTIDQVVNNPEMYNAFKQYINTHVPVEQQKMANLYLFLNNNQTTTMFKNNNKDLEDLADIITDNPYAVPNNIFERIMYGDPSKTKVIKVNGQFREVQDKGFSSYGLFLNNPVSNGILKSSNNIENWMRSSTILNDLQHQGYTMEDICDILGSDKVAEKALRDKFKMSMNEALNTMYAANFDYDNVSSFMNKASYILPFPTFYLKNLAFWADIFTNKPQLIDNVISTHEGLWAGKDTSKDEFTAEAKGRGAIPIGQQKTPITKHLTGIVKQTPYNSMFGAFNAVNDFKEDFAYRTNPVLRPIARHLQDPKDVKYRPYNTNQYQKNITQADPQFSELAYMFHQLNPYERFINTGLRTPGKVSRNEYQLSDFLPSIFQPDFSKK